MFALACDILEEHAMRCLNICYFLLSLLLQLMDRNSPTDSISKTKTIHTIPSETTQYHRDAAPKTINIPLNCSGATMLRTCPANYYPLKVSVKEEDRSLTPSPTCPDYFRWIHEDLWPWRETGITQEMVMRARRTANFRLVVLDGKAYVETFVKSFQSRDTFTIWGILQLLRRYPGQIPDLDLMFDCVDWPVIKKDYFQSQVPPPLFRYCGNDSTHDIVFPDWSFWGWYVHAYISE